MPATKAQREAAARARAGRARARLGLEGGTPTDPATQSTPQAEDDGEVCCWDGGVNAWSDDDSDDAEWIDEEDLRVEGEPEESDSDEVESLVDDELRVSLEKEVAQELEALSKATPYEAIQKRPITAKEWSAAESRVGVKNGLSARTERRNAKGLRDKEIQDAKLRKTAEAAFFRGYFAKGRVERASSAPSGSTTGGEGASASALEDDRGIIDDDALFDGYLSDLTDSSGAEEDAEGADDWYDEDVYNAPDVTDDRPSSAPASINNSPIRDASPARSASPDEDHHPDDAEDAFAVRPPPPLKRRRLEVPARQARAHKAAEVLKKRHAALRDIKRQLSSKQSVQGGHNGLLSYRMRAIQACLHLMVKDKMRMIAASKTAAKAHLLSQGWGSRQVRRWVREYVNNRALPESRRGLHAKAFSIFGDPIVRAGVRAYMRSNKWSMNPAKLRQLMQNELERDEAVAYAKEIVSQEMPRGLKHYVEKELLPRMHQKTRGKGFSLSAMRRLMLREGFVCTS